MNQLYYIDMILDEFCMVDCHPIGTPMAPGTCEVEALNEISYGQYGQGDHQICVTPYSKSVSRK